MATENYSSMYYKPGTYLGSSWNSGMYTPVGVAPLPGQTAAKEITSPGTTPTASTDMTELTNLINSLNQTNQTANLNARIPQAEPLQTQSSANIASALSGTVPQDVINQLAQSSAQRGVMTGSPTGASTNADYMRALGLTSTGLMNTGEGWLSNALARNPAVSTTNAADVWKMQQEAALAAQQLEQQKYIADLQAATSRQNALLGRSGTGGTSTSGGIQSAPDYSWLNDLFGGSSYSPAVPTTTSSTNYNWSPSYQDAPAGTYYNQNTNTSNYDYGLGSYDVPYDWFMDDYYNWWAGETPGG